MKLYVVARTKESGQPRAIEVLDSAEDEAAFRAREHWRNIGFDATVLIGEDLHDVMQSHPTDFEGA